MAKVSRLGHGGKPAYLARQVEQVEMYFHVLRKLLWCDSLVEQVSSFVGNVGSKADRRPGDNACFIMAEIARLKDRGGEVWPSSGS
jgi:hypothetical protein